jgi:hypothetical protein
MDASVGLADFHLGGRRCNPPIGKMLAGADSLAVDRQGAALLGMDWTAIPYLNGTRIGSEASSGGETQFSPRE